MQHPDTKIPQAHSAVLPDTAKPIALVVAPPRIERDRRDPRAVSAALAARHQRGRLGRTPDRQQIILPAGQDIFPIGRPADAGEGAVIGVVEVEESVN